MATAKKINSVKDVFPKGKTPLAAKSGRLVARVSAETQSMVTHAAEMTGATISQFLVEAAMEKASQILGDLTRIRLKQEEAHLLFDLLDKPPAPNKKLKSAAKQYKMAGLHAT